MTTVAEATPTQMRWHRERKERSARLGTMVRLRVDRGPPLDEEKAHAVASVWSELSEPEQQPFITDTEYPDAPIPLWKTIVREVAAKHDFTVSEIIGSCRARELVAARQEAFFRLRTETTMSLPMIGYRMGGKDHTTVINGINKHKARMGQG